MDKIQNYAKVEKIKSMLIEQMKKAGFDKKASEDDLNNILFLFTILSERIFEKKDDKEKVNMLLTYILILWARLLIEHGVDPRSL